MPHHSSSSTAVLTEWLETLVRDGATPGLAALVATSERTLYLKGTGHLAPGDSPATPNTVYDAASLTKPVVTALLTLQLAERLPKELKTPLQELLPQINRTPWGPQPLHRFLVHASGLPDWAPLGALCSGPRDWSTAYHHLQPAYEPGTDTRYSCLDYILLGKALENSAGSPLPVQALEKIFGPLGMNRTFLGQCHVPVEEVAPTEEGNRFEKEKALAAGFDVGKAPWRTGLLRGEVNDGNASFLGGYAGNAGLFTTAEDLLRFGQWLLMALRIRNAAPVKLSFRWLGAYTSDQAPAGSDRRTYGWLLALTPGASGNVFSPTAFGHTGFTGSSLWLDPERDLVAGLLTNRIYPEVRPVDMTAVRREFHRLALGCLRV